MRRSITTRPIAALSRVFHCAVLVPLSCAFVLGCTTTGAVDSPSPQTPSPTVDPAGCNAPSPEESAANEKIMTALAPTCAGCHTSGNKVFFPSLRAFESSLVYNTTYVVPGKPDESRLILLLEGTAKPPGYTQMPTGGSTYAALANTDTKLLPMRDIRAWVAALARRTTSAEADSKRSLMTRLSANQLRTSLQTQLGLSDVDLYATGFDPASGNTWRTPRHPDFFPFLGNDQLPAPRPDNNAPYTTRDDKGGGLHEALGGPTILFQVNEDRAVSASFATALTQISQAWCRLAVQKAGNEALFANGAMPSELSAPGTQTKAILSRWVWRFLARRATPGEVERMFDTLYLPLATTGGAETGFTGACAYLVRHPDNVFY
jgi:hypothetical protein